MKLALFSDQRYDETKKITTRLLEIVGKSEPSIGYISSSPDPTQSFYQESKAYYAKFGVKLTPYVDMEEGYNAKIVEQVLESDAIHLSGGNTFRFLHWIDKRGMDKRLVNYAKTGGVLIGVSAGAILMTPDIAASEICGDVNSIGLTNTKGLALIDFQYAPHANTDNQIYEKALAKSRKEQCVIVVAADADGIIVNEEKLELFGNPVVVSNGQITNDIKKHPTGDQPGYGTIDYEVKL